MTKVSQLSIMFRDQLQKLQKDSVQNPDVVDKKPPDSSSGNERDRLTSTIASWPSSSFQMPLQYPNYTKEEYEIMSEDELDRLLKLYGLPTDVGDLSCKQGFAVGAFLWEKGSSMAEHDSVNPNSSISDLDESSLWGLMAVLMKDMVHFIFRA